MGVTRRVRPSARPATQGTYVVQSRPSPRHVPRSLLAAPSRGTSRAATSPATVARRRVAVGRLAARGVAFYLLTATLIAASVVGHEYAHYAAHEGFGMPAMAYSPSVAEAQESLLSTQRSRGTDGDLLVRQPQETTIVVYPNTLLQAAALGVLPEAAYQDGGVLASTYFHLEAGEARALKANGGEMPSHVVAAPLWLAGAVFLAACAWATWRPNLFSKALLVASAVQLGDTGHHAGAVGLTPGLFALVTMVAIVIAGLLVALRSTPLKAAAPAKPVRPDFRPATRVVLQAQPRSPAPRVSVRLATDKPLTRPGSKPTLARPPVTWT